MAERQKFFGILSMNVFRDEDISHELLGHLAEDEFTAGQTAKYLEIFMSTFRRYVATASGMLCKLEVGKRSSSWYPLVQ